jgi:hypothetical protein
MDELALGLDTAAAQALDDALTVTTRSAGATSLYHDRTGLLRHSTVAKLDRAKLRGSVSNAVKYARYVEEGTRPHVIRPRRAKMLRFTVGGRVVFSHGVHHPGTSPRPFMRVAGEAGEAALSVALDARVDAAIRRSHGS